MRPAFTFAILFRIPRPLHAGPGGPAPCGETKRKGTDDMAKHMELDERKAIAHGIGCGLTFAELAGMLSRAESTIANEVKNRMLWSKVLYNLNGWNHVTVGRNHDGDVATFSEHINQHSRCYPYVRLLFFVCFVLESTVMTLELLFLVKS